MIPEAAVETAARAIYERKFGPEGWEGLPDKPRKQYADEARFILEAAAPHMLAAAYDLGIQHGANQPPNPYRARADQVTSSEETQNA